MVFVFLYFRELDRNANSWASETEAGLSHLGFSELSWCFVTFENHCLSLDDTRAYPTTVHVCWDWNPGSTYPGRLLKSPFPPVGRWFFHWPCDIVLSYLPPFFFFPSQWLSSLKAEPAFFILFYSQKLVQHLVCTLRYSLDVQWIKGVRLGVEEEESVGLQKKPSKICVQKFQVRLFPAL